MDNLKKAAELIMNSKYALVLTGAGISTESGIPDFRSSTGYYSKMDPMEALSRDVLNNHPERFYKEGYVILKDLYDKEPNAGHIALSELESMGYVKGLITQNIDNLHHKAGSKKVYEVHGETRSIRCNGCGKNSDFSVMKEKVEKGEIPPKCDSCNATLRPNVVMFGDMMPPAFEKAMNEIDKCDLLIVVGSSLTVAPVSYLPRYVENLIIINDGPTPYDRDADFKFSGSAGETLAGIVEELKILKEER